MYRNATRSPESSAAGATLLLVPHCSLHVSDQKRAASTEAYTMQSDRSGILVRYVTAFRPRGANVDAMTRSSHYACDNPLVRAQRTLVNCALQRIKSETHGGR